MAANFIAAFEAMLGLLSFSFITGLLYGRFSKPKAAIHFSENIILRNFNNKRMLMFRIINSRKTVMIEPEVTVTLVITKEDEAHKFSRNYYRFSLEREKNANLLFIIMMKTIQYWIMIDLMKWS
ncbi:hypothetical protein [Tenacibaculum maritimum]|uniref:hypothetical protein n=1 Tax=Tenacibaculum maritimum TaxID=107401 RepID=UPI002307C9DE|nr:hypothetical protein [Tenacibaculum maritimum]MDB0602512.1 hypothetical protein [Tenacibaculum maritimum]MDB0613775.1 hypothetical protein [Tenacibaculum maritimum]